MLERKKLAYGDGKAERPVMRKSLVFSTIAVLVATASCCAATDAYTRSRPAPARPSASHRPLAVPQHHSDFIQSQLQPQEKVAEIVHLGSRDFVLTNTSLLIVSGGEGGRFISSEIEMIGHAVRTDLTAILQRGLVDWEPSERRCFFLTRDRTLTVIPNQDMGDTIPGYSMPFETAGLSRERMQVHNELLFIAPYSGSILTMSFSTEDGESRYLPLGPGAHEDVFSSRGGRFYFGDRSAGTEIRVSGNSVNDVTIVIR
ncbi:MAG: hypothetical protein U0R44_05705 [Candidatus Micrarchaeia archaeon]